MSTTPGAFSGEDAFSGEAAEHEPVKQNGRPELAEEGVLEGPAAAELVTPFIGDVRQGILQETVETAEPPATRPEPLLAGYEYVPPPPLPRRKPDLADCLLFALLGIGAFFCSGLLMLGAVHYHLFGVSNFKQANEEIHYRIGSQAAWYIITLLFCVIVFRLAWRKSFFDGLQWRADTAARRIWQLVGAASACFVAAIVDELVMPGPTNAPIDQTFRMPGAVWLLFGFGVTLAPLIEEIAFRGFLLPALCTAWDWASEHFNPGPSGGHALPLPPEEDGFPHWSRPAMIFGSVIVSIPFALMHGEQTAYSIGPFLLLVSISLVLCWVRLAVRSLAASVIVHSSYNLLLFALMFLGTGGFKHLDNM